MAPAVIFMRRQARNISLDQEIDPSFDCDILDMRLLEEFIKLRGLKTKPSLEYFLKIKAAQRYDHTCHPTIGGVLLFCSTLPDEYSCARFRVSRFKAENRADLINSITINDGLLAMPEKIMDFVQLYMERKIEISALRKKEDYELIKQGAPLGSREIAGKLNIHQNTALKRLRQLEEKGLIYKQGSGPRVRYSV
jgi:predicted HTH transcriptional regulator